MSLATKLAFIPNITTNYIPRATATGFVNGVIYDNGINVGIGTSSPTSKLHIYNSGADAFSTLETTTGYSAYNRNKNGNISWVYGIDGTSSNWIVFDETASAIRLAITSGGNVGIGTSSPVAKLSMPLSTTNSQLSTGSIEIQSYSVNNSWVGDNIYYDGTGMRARSTGYTHQIYFGTTDGIKFYTGASAVTAGGSANATERMRITNTGNVGIGTTSPNSLATGTNLIVRGATDSNGYIQALSGDGACSVALYSGSYSGDNPSLIFQRSLRFGTATDVATNGYTERMRITSDGLIVGGTNIAYTSTNRGNITLNGSSNNILAFANGTTSKGYLYHTGTDMILQNDTTGNLYATNGSGGVYLSRNGTSWTANSDERLKDINSKIENAVDKIKTLRAVNFSWKADESKREVLGLIAQDVEKVFPQVVDKNKFTSKADEEQTDETEYLGVRYQELVPVLIAAIQEQQEQINSLKAQIGGNTI